MTFEFLNLALALAATSAFRFKNIFACPRPVEYTSDVQPMLPTPEHGSFPSGHATEAFMAVHVLCALACGSNAVNNIDAMYARLYEQASRIALNRTVAGLHFPLDSHAGELLGRKLAEYLLARSGFCRAGGQPTGLNVEQFDANDTKSHVDYLQHKPSKSYADYLASLPPLPTANWAIEPVAWLFEQAAHEWA